MCAGLRQGHTFPSRRMSWATWAPLPSLPHHSRPCAYRHFSLHGSPRGSTSLARLLGISDCAISADSASVRTFHEAVSGRGDREGTCILAGGLQIKKNGTVRITKALLNSSSRGYASSASGGKHSGAHHLVYFLIKVIFLCTC